MTCGAMATLGMMYRWRNKCRKLSAFLSGFPGIFWAVFRRLLCWFCASISNLATLLCRLLHGKVYFPTARASRRGFVGGGDEGRGKVGRAWEPVWIVNRDKNCTKLDYGSHYIPWWVT